ncbi:MAG: hypothetical protein Q4F54_04845 [Coriobacteriia bacterium]|nr:hypothetical protein [Coriobacteriia bacterium]
MVEPEDVVFDKSFKDYTQLQSISMWFMADMFGTQTVKNFYSPTDSNPKNPGFANMFTGNLTDVSYAFGGLFQEVNALPNMLMPTQELTNSVFDETKDVVLNQLWSNDYETYGTSLENIDLTGFDFSNIKDMSYMFANCVSLKNIKFDSNLDTSRNLYNMGTFANCENLGPVFSNSVQN